MGYRQRHRGTTTQRGYGHDHQRLRKQLLARWRPGDICARCLMPMWGPPAYIDLGHTADRTGYTGLEHRRCNRADGARRGNQRRRITPAQQAAYTSTRW